MGLSVSRCAPSNPSTSFAQALLFLNSFYSSSFWSLAPPSSGIIRNLTFQERSITSPSHIAFLLRQSDRLSCCVSFIGGGAGQIGNFHRGGLSYSSAIVQRVSVVEYCRFPTLYAAALVDKVKRMAGGVTFRATRRRHRHQGIGKGVGSGQYVICDTVWRV